MASLTHLRWNGSGIPGIPRRDRAPCEYASYVPDPLLGRILHLEGAVAADVAEAESSIARLDAETTNLRDTEALARLLLRAESVASSRIEGLEIGGRRLLRAEAASIAGDATIDVTAAEVLANIEAMTWSVERLSTTRRLQVEDILETHRRLLQNSRLSEHAGRLRDEQNWIGGSSYNPCRADFVPPPPDAVPELMEDLCRFIDDDVLSPVVQAAMAHAQFETIHPFTDGNGRTGRALIHVILRRRGLTSRVIVPISLVLATRARDYVAGLTATRYVGPDVGEEARAGMNTWIGTFAAACTRAVGDALLFEERIEELRTDWRERLGRVRAGSAVELLLGKLPGAPIMTVQTAADLIGRSYQQTNLAVTRLETARILARTTVGQRNRAFEAGDVLDAFTGLERQLASPDGDTRTSPPLRRVPRRPT